VLRGTDTHIELVVQLCFCHCRQPQQAQQPQPEVTAWQEAKRIIQNHQIVLAIQLVNNGFFLTAKDAKDAK
jgi:Tfp pilus assembly protein PilF